MQSILSFLVETAYPDADRDGSAATEPYRSLRLSGLLHTLIDYARQLIVTARTHAGTPGFAAFARPFGTDSLKLLIARIGCAITRASHLEQKLGDDARLGPKYVSLGDWDKPPAARAAPADRAPRARPAVHAARAEVREVAPAIDPELAHLPTVAQIAAEIRRLPMEQVIATICRDLGIGPDHALWQELDQALAAFGVKLSVAAQEPDAPRRRTGKPRAGTSAAAAQSTRPPSPVQTEHPACTGPPEPIRHSIAA